MASIQGQWRRISQGVNILNVRVPVRVISVADVADNWCRREILMFEL